MAERDLFERFIFFLDSEIGFKLSNCMASLMLLCKHWGKKQLVQLHSLCPKQIVKYSRKKQKGNEDISKLFLAHA